MNVHDTHKGAVHATVYLIERHRDRIVGMLEGFDRVLFRGTLRPISYVAGCDRFLGAKGLLLKDFKPFVQRCTAKKLAAHAEARAGRPYRYLVSSATDKETVASLIAQKDGIEQGLI